MRALQRLTAVAIIFALAGAWAATAAGHRIHHGHCHFCGIKTCRLKVERETEKVPCFEVECEDVCIPPLTFPWQCRPSGCAKVRTVRVLKEEQREREVCVYAWEVVTICPRCKGALSEAGCDVAPGVVEADVVE